MSKNQIKIGSLLSYLQIAINIIIQLLYTPVMLRLLGQSEYGLYNTVASTISMLSILSLGFNSGYIKYYSIYQKKNDAGSIAKLNGLFIVIFSIIGIISLVCGLFLTSNLSIVFKDGLSVDEYKIAKTLMLLLTLNLAISFPMSVFSNIISAHERFIVLKVVGMVRTVAGPLVTLPLLLAGFRSVMMVSVSIAFSLLADGMYLCYVVFVMKEKFFFSEFEFAIIKSLFSYVIFIAINIIIDQINWNIDKLLLGRYKGTSEVAVYSVGFTLYNSYQLFSTAISSFFIPQVHRIVNATADDSAKQKKELTDIFIFVGRIQFIVLGLVSAGIAFWGKYFISIWAGEEYANSYYVAIILIISSSIALIQNLGIEIQRAENRHQFRSIVYLIMAIINFGISIVLCQIYGAIGSAAGTAFSLVIANGFIMNIYYHKKCNIDIIGFWKSILSLMRALVIPLFVGYLLSSMIELKSFLAFIGLVVFYSIIYGMTMWFFGMNRQEKELIYRPFARFFSRR